MPQRPLKPLHAQLQMSSACCRSARCARAGTETVNNLLRMTDDYWPTRSQGCLLQPLAPVAQKALDNNLYHKHAIQSGESFKICSSASEIAFASLLTTQQCMCPQPQAKACSLHQHVAFVHSVCAIYTLDRVVQRLKEFEENSGKFSAQLTEFATSHTVTIHKDASKALIYDPQRIKRLCLHEMRAPVDVITFSDDPAKNL
jgi:hypothetical protein